MKDVVRKVAPKYPYAARKARLEGSLVVRLTIDPRTGAVTNVTVPRSTGTSVLDGAAMLALREWRFRPMRWKEVDIPIAFVLPRTIRRVIPPK